MAAQPSNIRSLTRQWPGSGPAWLRSATGVSVIHSPWPTARTASSCRGSAEVEHRLVRDHPVLVAAQPQDGRRPPGRRRRWCRTNAGEALLTERPGAAPPSGELVVSPGSWCRRTAVSSNLVHQLCPRPGPCRPATSRRSASPPGGWTPAPPWTCRRLGVAHEVGGGRAPARPGSVVPAGRPAHVLCCRRTVGASGAIRAWWLVALGGRWRTADHLAAVDQPAMWSRPSPAQPSASTRACRSSLQSRRPWWRRPACAGPAKAIADRADQPVAVGEPVATSCQNCPVVMLPWTSAHRHPVLWPSDEAVGADTAGLHHHLVHAGSS